MSEQFDMLAAALERSPRRVIACSGGVDSLLLADVAHELQPRTTIIAHSVSPAVPPSATRRVRQVAADLGWRLELVNSHEFEDPRYLANPRDRCYFCKSNLYTELDRVGAAARAHGADWTVMSGANADDLGEYRPGLVAASEHDVRHPFVEARMAKADIRTLARSRDRSWHDLTAAPCLASRLYTGTAVTADLLRAVDQGENLLRERAGVDVVRCRIDGDEVLVETRTETRSRLTPTLLDEVLEIMRSEVPTLRSISLDEVPYAPGRAFVAPSATSRGFQIS
ncbi:adenine nucleotide alpha hydrolase [Mycobacterium sp.]|uniref:ATP-dependent sacrificial sulfur transferase LarE n=1 Tax=Mycobacterium sp. TaxID=1785 RepID=UPI0012116923|nr:adenine nucleotide alpha hydrolase [Mycobacterium sp.]TAM64494.1 MAG: ATPase [Mycobacterium sp.]